MKHKYFPWIKEAAEQIEALKVPRKRQEDLGWTDFHADPPPATDHLHEFASLAVELCCFDEEGRWARQAKLLYAIVAATEAVSSRKVATEDLAELFLFAELGDSTMENIRFWFQMNFPPSNISNSSSVLK